MATRRSSLKVGQHLAGAQDDAGQRIFGDGDGQPGLLANPLIQILQHRAAARQYDAAIADIGAQFRRRPFQRDADRIHDSGDAFAKALREFRCRRW